jgi:hypothetical protein
VEASATTVVAIRAGNAIGWLRQDIRSPHRVIPTAGLPTWQQTI